VWSSAAKTYFNNGLGPDPWPSPSGVYPFSATDTAVVTFDQPGVHTLEVVVADDDEGLANDSLPKLVTGDLGEIRTVGFWRHEFSGKGRTHLDPATLESYLHVVNFASSVFSEAVSALTPAEARQVLQPGGADVGDPHRSNMHGKAIQQALAAWLNFASGAIGWEEPISNGQTFGDAMAAVERILLDPTASHKDYVTANQIATSINEMNESDPELLVAALSQDGLALPEMSNVPVRPIVRPANDRTVVLHGVDEFFGTYAEDDLLATALPVVSANDLLVDSVEGDLTEPLGEGHLLEELSRCEHRSTLASSVVT
jgi:hypothetical protein